jgi:glycerate-2-kinase
VRCCVAAPAFTDMNCVRKHLSAIKGGRLAAAAPAQVVSLIIPDVPGDDPSVIAHPVRRCPTRPRSPMLGDPAFERTVTRLVATPQAALEAAAEVARQTGVLPLILGDSIEGEATEVGRVMGGIAPQVTRHHQPAPPPCVLISGGETTVTVHGHGRGARNVEFLLALAIELNGLAGVYALAADTDGVDGAAKVAGAFITPDTTLPDAICSALRRMAGVLPISAAVSYTSSGFTSLCTARERPAAPILSISPNQSVAARKGLRRAAMSSPLLLGPHLA